MDSCTRPSFHRRERSTGGIHLFLTDKKSWATFFFFLITESPESSFVHVRTQQEESSVWTRKLSPDTESFSTWILDFPAFGTVRNTCLLFKPPGLCYFCYSSRVDEGNVELWWISGSVWFCTIQSCLLGVRVGALRAGSLSLQGWAAHRACWQSCEGASSLTHNKQGDR